MSCCDVVVEFPPQFGIVAMVYPRCPEVTKWLTDRVAIAPWQWQGAGFVCELTALPPILAAMQAEGYTIEGRQQAHM